MLKTERVGSLEIEHDMPFQRRVWFVQRVGWVLMAVLLASALLGTAGGGPVSRARAASGDGSLSVEYERFGRRGNVSPLRISFRPRADADGLCRIWIEREYLEQVRIEEISPAPWRQELSAEQVIYVWPAPGDDAFVSLVALVAPEHPGRVRGRIGLADGTRVEFGHFVYP